MKATPGRAVPHRTVPPIQHSHLCLWHLCNDLTRHVITHSSEIGGFRGAGQKVEHAKCCMHPMHINSERLSIVLHAAAPTATATGMHVKTANSTIFNAYSSIHTSQPHWSEELTKTCISLINNLKFSCFFSCSNFILLNAKIRIN